MLNKYKAGLTCRIAKESGVIANTVVMIKVHFILFYFIHFIFWTENQRGFFLQTI